MSHILTPIFYCAIIRKINRTVPAMLHPGLLYASKMTFRGSCIMKTEHNMVACGLGVL